MSPAVPLLVISHLLASPFVVVESPTRTELKLIPSLAGKAVGRTSLAGSTVDSIQNCPDSSVGVEYSYYDPDSPDQGDLVELEDLGGPDGPDGPGGPDGPIGSGGSGGPDGPFVRGSAYLGPIG